MSFWGSAQQNDSISVNPELTLNSAINQDSTSIQDTTEYTTIDSLHEDSSLDNKYISKDAFLDEIISNATDSTIIDHQDEKMYLYGDAVVKFQTMELKAGKIIIDYKLNEATAYPGLDSLGREAQKPHFIDGENEFTCDKLRYNFDSKKGIVYEARTKENDLFVLGNKTKFISKDADSTLHDDIVYTENALITSCDDDHPHFGILAKKMKVIPGKVAVVGTSWLKIMDIPLVPLPFGFFPMNKGRSTGLIFPRDFTIFPTLDGGVKLRGIGWYVPINDYLDLQVMGDISSRGDWGLRTITRYDVKYKYRGSVNISYAKNYSEDIEGNRVGSPAFSIILNHNQDAKAHPYRKIHGSVNISTRDFYKKDRLDPKSQLTNTYTSNFGLAYTVPNSPVSFKLDLRHEQNTNTKLVTVNLPVASMRLNTIYPFKSKKVGSNKEKWFEKISFAYNSAISNKINATDSTLFKVETLKTMQNGMKQHAQTGASFKVAKYFNLNFGASIDEHWTLKTLNRFINDSLVIKRDTVFDEILTDRIISTSIDTTEYGVVEDEFNNGFAAQRNINANVSLSTKIFSTYQRKKGFMRGLRHTISPSVSLNYNPDTKSKYEELYFNDLRESERDSLYFNPFEKAVYKSGLRRKGLNVGYGIGNLIEAKYYSKKDTIAKKLKLFNNIRISGDYNIAADSLKWSTIKVNASTPLFWGWSNLRINGSLDPYKEVNGRRVNTFVWDGKFKFAEVEQFTFTLSTSFSIKKIMSLFDKTDKSSDSNKNGGKRDDNKESFKAAPAKIISLIESFTISHNLIYLIQRHDDRDTSFLSTHSFTINGSIPVSENWSINLSRISYDFIEKKINYPSLGFTRKLHCWSMDFNWNPYRDSFGFNIGVNSSTLEFLKTNYGKNQTSGSFY